MLVHFSWLKCRVQYFYMPAKTVLWIAKQLGKVEIPSEEQCKIKDMPCQALLWGYADFYLSFLKHNTVFFWAILTHCFFWYWLVIRVADLHQCATIFYNFSVTNSFSHYSFYQEKDEVSKHHLMTLKCLYPFGSYYNLFSSTYIVVFID